MSWRSWTAAAATTVLVAVPLAATASGVTPEALAELRAEVDTAAAEIELERSAARDELAALRGERAELERQLRAAQSRGKTLSRIQSEATERAEADEAQAIRWHAPTQAALAEAKAYVERGIPFAQAERAALLEQLERDLGAAKPDYGRIALRLWRFLEEEDAMVAELTRDQQRMTFGDTTQIVDVIRMGLALQYVQTPDGAVGWSVRESGTWRTELIEDPALAELIRARFEAHDNNRGWGPARLVLPGTLPEGQTAP